MLLTNHGTVKLLSKQQVINYRAKKSRFFCETAPTNHNKQYSISISLSWQPAIKLCRIFWFLFLCLMSGPWRIFIFPLKGSETLLQVVAKRVEGIEYKLSINLPLWKHHLLSLWWTSRKFFSCISNRLALFRQSATTASINTHTWYILALEGGRNGSKPLHSMNKKRARPLQWWCWFICSLPSIFLNSWGSNYFITEFSKDIIKYWTMQLRNNLITSSLKTVRSKSHSVINLDDWPQIQLKFDFLN